MQQLADRLDTIEGLNVYGWPPGSVAVPGAVVSYPDGIEVHAAYRRGMGRIELPVVVVVGKANDRAARDRISRYTSGSGPHSVIEVLESGTYTAFHEATVLRIEFDTITIGTTEYIAAVFAVDIVGSGS